MATRALHSLTTTKCKHGVHTKQATASPRATLSMLTILEAMYCHSRLLKRPRTDVVRSHAVSCQHIVVSQLAARDALRTPIYTLCSVTAACNTIALWFPGFFFSIYLKHSFVSDENSSNLLFCVCSGEGGRKVYGELNIAYMIIM